MVNDKAEKLCSMILFMENCRHIKRVYFAYVCVPMCNKICLGMMKSFKRVSRKERGERGEESKFDYICNVFCFQKILSKYSAHLSYILIKLGWQREDWNGPEIELHKN